MRHLLLVEDDATLLEVLRVAFKQHGWEVTVAQSLDEGLSRFSEASFDVVLTDKNLPGGAIVAAQAGVELVRQIRQRDREVGVVLMTAYGTAESARDTLNLGVDEYLEKPFHDLFDVLDRMGRLAERAAARRLSVAPARGALTVVIAASAERQRPIAEALGTSHRLLMVENPEAIKPSAQSERADVVILDGASYPEEITCLVVGIKTRARTASCVVLSQDLPLSDVKRLIDLEVKALIDAPIDTERFAAELRSAVDRVRAR
jgi:two-component system response regulator (stage 0 sporulation protein F)